jgi:two-component system, LytTR family, sensor kinase
MPFTTRPVEFSRSDAQNARVRRTPEFLIIVAGWTVVAVFFTGHNYLSLAANGNPIPLSRAAWWSVAEWYTWVPLTPLVAGLVRQWRPSRGGVGRGILILVVCGALVAGLQVALEYAADHVAVWATRTPELTVRGWLSDGSSRAALDLAYLIPRKIGFSFATYWCVVLVVLAADYHHLYRERELRAAHLETALASAQLEALQSQLQPHFLFNTLNAIASLIPDDPRAAEEMVESLGDLLRATLREAGTREVSLTREIELVRDYLRIQELRFEDRLHVELCADASACDALVPPLLLQPLAENAIRHGVASSPNGGTVIVRAARVGAELWKTTDPGSPARPATAWA